ncbi:unnamed protein product [Periconia digitata]|uniref:Uncharacterized protein n=1 Tax=Periconia digitata TaxID=1303443 RepID=A0A9W4UV51_9PLEO|nr:unnamed protein product [Periconia digitata]
MALPYRSSTADQAPQLVETSMAVSFTGGSIALANWGFSIGDIAVLAGAGRKAGNWVYAQFKDSNLIDWMGVDEDAVLPRKGLCDTSELHNRWDTKLVLIQNGQKTSISSREGTKMPVIDSMGRFTWIMTLVTAALNAAMQKSTMHATMSKLLLKIFEESEHGQEFLRREAAEHIHGWLSAACVRMIADKALREWARLEKSEQHQPGFIPEAEIMGIHHFLVWLLAGEKHDKIYPTPSTDIFCLAIILEDLGLKIRTTLHEHEVSGEGEVIIPTIVWSNKLAPTAFVRAHPKFRPGMRIPLQYMEEVTSLSSRNGSRNKLRKMFEWGMEAVQKDGIVLKPAAFQENLPRVKGSPFLESEQDLYYHIQTNSRDKIPRMTGDTNRFADWLLAIESPAACSRLVAIITELEQSKDEEHNIHTLAFSLDNQEQNSRSFGLQDDYDFGDALNYLQAFFLGYWYQLFRPLLETSQLEIQEGFGSWSWSDIKCLDFIREIVHTRMHQRTKTGKRWFMYRHEVMKLGAYLFGGAEIEQIRRATYGAVGIIGKIPFLYSSLVRGRPENFGHFSLMDIDSSCIPSSDNGIVLPGHAKVARFLKSHEVSNHDAMILPQAIEDVSIEELIDNQAEEEDLTLHIEPDWNNDSQTCLVVYRHKGRVVTRASPQQIDLAMARHFYDKDAERTIPEQTADNSPPYKPPLNCGILNLVCLQGGNPIEPEEQLVDTVDHAPAYAYNPLVLSTAGMINALLCIACLYEGWETQRRVEVVSTQKEFNEAVNRFAKVIVVSSVSAVDNTS